MDPVALTSGHLTGAISAANTMAAAVGGTFSHNSGWLILIATVGGIMFVLWFIIRRIAALGGGYAAPRYFSDGYPGLSDSKRKEWNRLDDYGMEDAPLSSFDSKEAKWASGMSLKDYEASKR